VRLSCLARNGRSPGEESLTAAVAVQVIEAQPAFGQIKPMRGEVLAWAEQHRGDVPANDRLKPEAPHSRQRKKETWRAERRPLSPNGQKKPAYPPAAAGAVCRRDHPAQSKRSSEGRDHLSVKLDDPSFNAPIYANRARDDKRVQLPARGGHPTGRMHRAECSARSEGVVGLHRQTGPGGAPNDGGTDYGKRFSPPFLGNANCARARVT
jgi:hypothetical protein